MMVAEQGEEEEEETGSERGGGELDGAGKPDWPIREWQIASAQTCWGVISPKKPERANLCHNSQPPKKRKLERLSRGFDR